MALFLEAFLIALASSTDNFMVGLSVGISNQSLSFGVNAMISICNAMGAWLAGFGGNILGQNLPLFISPLLSALTFGGLASQEFFEFLETARLKQKQDPLGRRKEKQKYQSNNDKMMKDDKICVINRHEYSNGNNAVANSSGIPRSNSDGKNLDTSRALQLAFPMTLNNLAGGVAGGAIGVSPFQAGIYGLLASFITMALGHSIGLHLARLSTNQKSKTSVAFRSILIDPSFVSASLLGILCLVSLKELLLSSSS